MTLREFSAANEMLERPEALREQIARDGFAFFRGLLPPGEVLAVRRAVLACCREGGWLVEGTPLEEGIADVGRATVEGEPSYNPVYRCVQGREEFHTLGHHPRILEAVGAILGEPALPHPLKICRLIFPQNVAHTTPAHQDFVFIQGTPETYTVWFPLGDCPRELGGLQVNGGTHRGPILAHHIRLGAGGMGVDTEELPDNWYTTDYRAGDVLIFHSYLVHKGLPNLSADRMRVSVDYRYQAVSQPIGEMVLKPHFSVAEWEELYRGWRSTDLQYYWRNHDLLTVAYDTQYTQNRDREAFEAARRGDPVARAALLRIVQRDKDPERRARAAEALAELEAKLTGGRT